MLDFEFEFESLKLKNCIYFKKASIPLNKGAIIQITGKNLKSREKNQNNGSGKSLLFSYIPNIINANHPLAIKANSKKELFLDEGEATLNFKKGEDKYSVTQFGGSSIRYEIYKNNELENFGSTTTKSEKYLEELFPFSEQEFYTMVYLNSQREFIFQRGKFEQRLSFFTDFFRLDYYDRMKEHFQETLRNLKKLEISASTLETQRQKFVKEIDELSTYEEIDVEKLELKKKKLNKEKQRLKVSLKEKQNTLNHVLVVKNIKKNIGDSIKPEKESIDNAKIELELLEKQKTIKDNLTRLSVRIKTNKVKIKELKSELDSIYQKLFNKDFDVPFELDLNYESEYKKAVSIKENNDKINIELSQLKYELSNLKKPKIKEQAIEDLIQAYSYQVNTYNKAKSHIDDGKCPTCGTEIDMESLKALAEVAKADIAKLKNYKNYYTKTERVKVLESELEPLSEDDYKSIVSKYKKSALLHAAYKNVNKLFNNLTQLEDLLKSEKEEFNSYKKDYKDNLNTEDIKELNKFIHTSTKVLELYNHLDSYILKAKEEGIDVNLFNSRELTAEIQQLEDELSSIENEASSLDNSIHKSKLQKEKLSIAKGNLKDVEIELDTINAELHDKEIIETLIKVYSSKGIKLQKVNEICRLIEKNLNHYKSLLFGENFKFEINITDKSFDVIVDRGDGVISDVRLLSGSEGRKFNLLLLISLLPLTPKSRRSNLVILDEMESNADEASVEMFCNRFIPELHKYIPNIMVVTPLNLKIPNSKKLVVIKDNNGSRIEQVKNLED